MNVEFNDGYYGSKKRVYVFGSVFGDGATQLDYEFELLLLLDV